MRKRHLANLARTLTCLLLPALAAQAAQPLLTITDLGQATGLSNLEARDINNRSDVLLSRQDDAAVYVWNASSGLFVIQEPGQSPIPLAISDTGEVVGINAGFGVGPFRWDRARGFRVPQLEPGLDGGALTAVNASGQAAGMSSSKFGNGKQRAATGSEDGVLRRVRGAGKGPSQANTINAAGMMGGWVKRAEVCCQSAALFGKKGEPTLIGTLAHLGERDHSIVHALNDLGQAVGESAVAGRPHAFYWSTTAGMIDIHPQGDNRRKSMATDINRSGAVVGVIDFWEHPTAFFWDPDTGFVDLNDRLDPSDPLAAVTQVTDSARINDQGQIIANAVVRGVRTAVLLTPRPAGSGR